VLSLCQRTAAKLLAVLAMPFQYEIDCSAAKAVADQFILQPIELTGQHVIVTAPDLAQGLMNTNVPWHDFHFRPRIARRAGAIPSATGARCPSAWHSLRRAEPNYAGLGGPLDAIYPRLQVINTGSDGVRRFDPGNAGIERVDSDAHGSQLLLHQVCDLSRQDFFIGHFVVLTLFISVEWSRAMIRPGSLVIS
jgi:hypothetical protein